MCVVVYCRHAVLDSVDCGSSSSLVFHAKQLTNFLLTHESMGIIYDTGDSEFFQFYWNLHIITFCLSITDTFSLFLELSSLIWRYSTSTCCSWKEHNVPAVLTHVTPTINLLGCHIDWSCFEQLLAYFSM